jgi:hypothetical protein
MFGTDAVSLTITEPSAGARDAEGGKHHKGLIDLC